MPSAARPSSTRETDVLDTWFSSALWPYATLGWPDETPELARYYPGNVNSTAREIIRLWENRMIWTGLEVLGEDPVHRRDHPLHGARARRPAHVEEPRHRHRPDAADRGVRSGRDTVWVARRSPPCRTCASRTVQSRKGGSSRSSSGTSSRLILQNAVGVSPRGGAARSSRSAGSSPGSTRPVPSSRTPGRDSTSSESTATLYHLTFDDFCDWYAEALKPRLYDRDPAAISTALTALERLLALLHPVMPHVTEEIWSQLPGRQARLIVSPWPEPAEAVRRRRDRARSRAGGGADLPA